jgi:adenosine kinase
MSAQKNFQGAILGMCNPLLDISAEVPEELLKKYELSLNNAILAEEKHLPLYDELVKTFPVQYIAGGATQNSIRVAQWMLKIPGSTSYFGAVGNDAYGEQLEKCAMEDGVRVIYQKNPTVPTGTCAVLVHGGERSLVANLAAANTFTASHLDTVEAKEAVEQAQLFYISGFFLTVSVDSILSIAKHAVEKNKIFAMNLSAPFLVQFFGDQMAAVVPYADFVFGNESEAAAYGAAKEYGSDLSTIALRLAAQPKASGTRPRIVVFTQGSESTIVAVNGVVTVYPVDPLPRELLVDTNGAGDAFVGGFLSQLIQDKPLAECVRAGHWAARVIIQRSGCTFPKDCDFY